MPSDKNVTVHIEHDIIAVRFQAEDGREVTVDVRAARRAARRRGARRPAGMVRGSEEAAAGAGLRGLGCRMNGRSERIRTSGPCVPRTSGHGDPDCKFY